ncbi:hypothetical protein HNR44_003080 [Geomicrobium halophilum]|uniref:ZIP Zinc transporter n=1 Tax=Geomicrobium halophilum TaxID=549000 RepID=A0A841PVB0_9BACL|nr:hypothetical protein [Geomicrobium halophilum]MBB6451086.1 hypothetical protein [Geomicrobium halophilum]
MISIESIVIGLVLIFIQLYALNIVERSPIGEQKLLSLSGGVAISYVFVYILPTLHEEQEKLGGSLALDTELYFLGLLALLVYFVVYAFAETKGATQQKEQTVYMVQISFFMVYTFIISYVVVSSDVQKVESLFYGLAISLHFIGLSYHLGKKHRPLHNNRGRYLLGGATLAGAITGGLAPSSGLFVDAMIAFSSGAMLFNVISKELPFEKEAHLPTFVISSLLYSTTIIALKAFFNW